MIITALVLAGFITAGFAILYAKLPKPIKKFLARRYILLDIILCWAVFSALGFAIIGVMTAAMVSLFVSGWLYFANQKEKQEKAN
jgi:hypothetical protein